MRPSRPDGLANRRPPTTLRHEFRQEKQNMTGKNQGAKLVPMARRVQAAQSSRAMLPIFALVLTAVVLAGCDSNNDCGSGGCVKGSGTVVTQVRPVDNFNTIRLDSIGDLVVEQICSDSLKVETDDNLQSIVTSTIKDGTLTLAEAGCKNCSPTRIVFTATVKQLQELDLPSTGSMRVSRLDGPSLLVKLTGTGSIKLSGRVGDLKISSSGTGNCDASELTAKSATVVLSGTGNVRVNAGDTLDAKNTGTGKISYLGSPKLTQSVSGVGSIQPETK
jgi:hypothetical protein